MTITKLLLNPERAVRRPVSWSIPQEWVGETVAILGGGPSLTPEQVEQAKRFRRIATNDAALVLDPEADVMCWGDQRWFFWNQKELSKNKSRYRITWRHTPAMNGFPFHTLGYLSPNQSSLSLDPGFIAATNTGHGAVNIAVLFGAKRILLLGFDMNQPGGKNNWHTRHKSGPDASRYQTLFVPELVKAKKLLDQLGIEVINCSPTTSRLQCFPFGDINQIF